MATERFKNLCNVVVDLLKVVIDIPYYIFLYFRAAIPIIYHFIVPQKRKSLNGETILITGAASGLGRDVALQIAKRYRVTFVLWDINEAGLIQTANECRDFGCKVLYYVIDLSNKDEIARVSNQVRNDVGSITILFNNAGLAYTQYFLDADPEKEEKMIKVNLLSYIWVIREFLPQMVKRGKGHVISTASGLGFMRFQCLSGYCASKSGMRGLMDTIRYELKVHHKVPEIKVTAIYPGFIKTPMTSAYSWKPRYNFLWNNMIEPKYAVERIVEGIEKEKDEIIVPQTVHFMKWFYGIIPSRFLDDVESYCFKDMDMLGSTTTAVQHTSPNKLITFPEKMSNNNKLV